MTASGAVPDQGERLPLGRRLAGTGVVLRHELRATFGSGVAWLWAIVAVLLSTSLYMQELFLAGRLDMAPFFDRLPWLAIVLAPAASMRLWAEERRHRTFELWRTLPLTPGQVVLGKLAAALCLWALFLAGTLSIPLLLVTLGDPDLGLVAAGYLAALSCGALLLALGGLCSALSRNQVSAFVAAVLASALLVASGHERVVALLDGSAPGLAPGTLLADHLSLLPRYATLASGLVTAADLVWLTGLTAVLAGLTTFVVARVRD